MQLSNCQVREKEEVPSLLRLMLDQSGEVSPQASKTHIRIPFELTEGCTRLHLHLEYAPKTLDDDEQALQLLRDSFGQYILPEQEEYAKAHAARFLPLKNLITLSLDDTQGYRGACHRQDEVQDLYVAEKTASPGLMAGALGAGLWNVTLSLHCIVTDTCTYRLQIWIEELDAQEEASVDMQHETSLDVQNDAEAPVVALVDVEEEVETR
jgi:hypothetical protein